MSRIYWTQKDTCSLNVAYSDEAVAEMDHFFKSKLAYIGTDGKFLANINTATIEYLLHNLTGT